jgi:uncharacterized protein YqeY
MTLYEKITGDLKEAMKAHEAVRVDVLRFSLAALNGVQKEKQLKEPGAVLTDEETTSVLQKEVKRRKDSIELFRQGGRNDLVEKEEGELAIVAAYLPKELSREEIAAIVDGVIAAGAKDFNTAMRETMKAVKGRADGKAAGDVIKAKLGSA